VGGIPRGGVNQEPIRLLAEVASAGLNILSGRPPETTADLSSNAPLSQHFDGPDALSEWVWTVLGDLEIGVCDGCDRGALPGKGLIPHIEQRADRIAASLSALVSGTNTPNRDNLATVSAPGIAVTHQVIEAIRNQSASERAIIVQKLSQEISEARTIEEAMIVRRLLLTGRRDGNISAVKMAVKEVDRALIELEKEINNVIYEKKTREAFVADTIIEVLLQDNAKRQSAMSLPPINPVDGHKLKGGAINP